MKKQETAVEQIDFNKLRRDLQTLMEEVDRRLTSEFDAFSPTMWKRLQRAVDRVILEISAVRLALNGYTTAEVARKLGLKKQQVAAFLAYNTMWQTVPQVVTDAMNQLEARIARAAVVQQVAVN
jgi:plasmid maintenance system antidote protein VapI